MPTMAQMMLRASLSGMYAGWSNLSERADEKAAKKASEQSHFSSQNYAFGRSVLTHLANPIFQHTA
jgi:threonine/homoserine/homoserine lactone efflux protein